MLSQPSYRSASSASREDSGEDMKPNGKDDASDPYGESFDSLSSKATSRTSGASKSEGGTTSGRRGAGTPRDDGGNNREASANAETAPVSQDVTTRPKDGLTSGKTRVGDKKKAMASNGDARNPLTRGRGPGRDGSKSMSTVSTGCREDATSRSTAGRIDDRTQRSEGRENTPQGGGSQRAAGASRSLSKKSQRESTGVSSCGEPITVSTTEELSNLIAQNDELRMKLLENGCVGRYSSGHKANAKGGIGRSTQKSRQYQKTTMAIQKSMRREQNRQELRKEREHLIALRNELRRKVAANKRLHAYHSLIEDCKADVTRLVQEKRALSLTIRQNEKVLINNEVEQGSDLANRRLKEEIKAEMLLVQRSLERAQRDACEAVKMHKDAELRVRKLEEQLEEANNREKAQAANNDPEVRELIEENQRKIQHIHQLRGQLRRMKLNSSSDARHGANEASARDARNERAYLVKRINQLRKEVGELSAKAKKRKAAEEAKGSAGLASNATGRADDPQQASTQKRYSGGEDPSLTVQKMEKQRGSTLRDEPSGMSEDSGFPGANTSCEHTEGAVDAAIEELKRRVGEARRSVETPATEQHSRVSSAPGTPNPVLDHPSLLEETHAPRPKPTQPGLVEGNNGAAPGVEGKGGLETAALGETRAKNAPNKDDNSTVPSWIDNDASSDEAESYTGAGKPANEAGLPVAEHHDGNDAGIHKDALAEAPANAEKNVGMQGKGEIEEDDVYTEIEEEEVTEEIGTDPGVDADAPHPQPKDEPSWLNFD